jgi:hypothetical protein
MRKILRIPAAVVAALSLLLSAVSIMLWVRSYWKTEGWGRFPYFSESRIYRQDCITCGAGRVQLKLASYKIDQSFVAHMEAERARGVYQNKWEPEIQSMRWRPRKAHWWERLGVYVRQQENVTNVVPGVGSSWFVVVPYWVLVVLFSIWPAIWGVMGWKRRRRFSAGRCQNCGYDVRASPKKCPECGSENTIENSEVKTQHFVT